MGLPEFKSFPKIPRHNRGVVISEKIDGTNAIVYVNDDCSVVVAGSRSRWVTPQQDNYGFGAWVDANAEELKKLGPGYHYGEWYGAGIQRRYGLNEKRFALFNTARWHDAGTRPKCCDVVPVLSSGPVEKALPIALDLLRTGGSVAVPGFMSPEGVVVYHTAGRTLTKVLLENDDKAKG